MHQQSCLCLFSLRMLSVHFVYISGLPQLVELNLRDTGLLDEGVCAVLASMQQGALPTLEVLDLGQNELTEKTAKEIPEVTMPILFTIMPVVVAIVIRGFSPIDVRPHFRPSSRNLSRDSFWTIMNWARKVQTNFKKGLSTGPSTLHLLR